jgi:transcriptional regulator with XRE-family HTH domain
VGAFGPSRKPATAATVARARELRAEGLTYVQIATRLGYSANTIRKIVNSDRKQRDPRANWKTAAKRIGVSLTEYTAHREAGERWCTLCRTFQHESRMKAGLTQCLDCSAD